MIIQCPSCGARAKLPDSKEGAKVRCGECQRIYVAGLGRRGSARTASSNNQGLWIGLGVAGLAAIVVLFMTGKGGNDAEAGLAGLPQDPGPEEPIDTGSGQKAWEFDGPAAKAARDLHRFAHARNAEDVRSRLHLGAIYAWKQRLEVETAAREAAAAEGAKDDEIEAAIVDAIATLPAQDELEFQFASLPLDERTNLADAWVEDLIDGASKDLVADWLPYDGEVLELTAERAILRLKASPADGASADNRTIEWELRKKGGRWQAARWERFLTESEKKDLLRERLASRSRNKGYEKVELSDGSKVLERQPEPLGYLDDTPSEVRTKIEGLMATMLDPNETRGAISAREELVAIGKPAIPPLLTKLYEIPLDTMEQSIQVNMVVVALRDITGQYFGYEPLEMEGSGVGTTRERRESAIKQWFAWWYRNEKKFTEKVEQDIFAEELTEEEKAYLERIK